MVYGRENAGQLFEITVSYVSMKILELMRSKALDVEDCVSMYLDFLRVVSPSMAESMEEFMDTLQDDDLITFISSLALEKSIYVAIEPMSENMTIDKVKALYERFSWAKPENLLMPVKDSAGKIRYVPSRRPLVYGYQYIYRLKQYAEEKFSVTSLSATNIKNENSKSKSSNNYKALYSRTPIRFGDMETGNLIHLGAELVVQMLMLYSTSPHARRLTSDMLTGDAFDVDIKLDHEAKNRNVEILNVYLKTMGLTLKFEKHKKKLTSAFKIKGMYFKKNPSMLNQGMSFWHPDENYDIEKHIKRLLEQKNLKQGFTIYPMKFYGKNDRTIDEEELEKNNK